MACFREMCFDDLFKINSLVFDALTEVYSLTFFVKHLLEFPELTQIAIAPGPEGRRMGYIFGTHHVPKNKVIYGHVAALTVSADYRRLGVASTLMKQFSRTMRVKGAAYVNLFMRVSNIAALQLYRSLGYVPYGTVKDYYPDPGKPESALELRKFLDRKTQ
ncbi:hypothetical protein KR018_010869 [Drosophila ironensis]|nr:hypothetical protein KR018_010869 [Drosophila ironensis]